MQTILKLYLNTGPLKGLLDSGDQEHERATKLFRAADEAGAQLYSPYPVLLELHRLLLYKKPPRSDAVARAQTVLKYIIAAYPVLHPTEEDILSALATLKRFADQKITLTDATVASMALGKKAKVMTFDRRHFGLMGIEVFEG